MDKEKKIAIIESILFASGDALSIERLCVAMDENKSSVYELLKEMQIKYENSNRGIRLAIMKDKAQLCTKSEHSEFIRRAVEIRKPSPLSNSALEVLSIVAYKQPVTKAYIEQIRGVDSVYTVNSLEEKGLIEACGKLDVPGKPTLFRTTTNFLRIFGIRDLRELPELPNKDDAFEQLHL